MTRVLLLLPVLTCVLGLSAPVALSAPRFHLDLEPPAERAGDDLSEEERRAVQERLVLRRKMVEVHQTLAFLTAGFIVAADVVGMGNHVALEHGDPKRSELEPALMTHRILVGAALGTYLGAGLSAWTMPPAWQRARTGPRKADSGDVHVALSVAHGIGMALMAGTGFFMANVARGETWLALLDVHTVTGFVTAGLVIAAAVTIGAF